MTDYLEWLLDLQEPEDEEDGETLAWCGAALDRLAVRRTEDGVTKDAGQSCPVSAKVRHRAPFPAAGRRKPRQRTGQRAPPRR